MIDQELHKRVIRLHEPAKQILKLAITQDRFISQPTISALGGSESQVSGSIAALTQRWINRVGTSPEGKAVFSLKPEIDKEKLKECLIQVNPDLFN